MNKSLNVNDPMLELGCSPALMLLMLKLPKELPDKVSPPVVFKPINPPWLTIAYPGLMVMVTTTLLPL